MGRGANALVNEEDFLARPPKQLSNVPCQPRRESAASRLVECLESVPSLALVGGSELEPFRAKRQVVLDKCLNTLVAVEIGCSVAKENVGTHSSSEMARKPCSASSAIA